MAQIDIQSGVLQEAPPDPIKLASTIESDGEGGEEYDVPRIIANGDPTAPTAAGQADKVEALGADPGNPVPEPPTPVLQSIAATPTTMPLAALATGQITSVLATYDIGVPVEVLGSCTFLSNDELVATVDVAGLVTAVAAGSTTITVSFTDGTTVTTPVTVTVT